MIRIKLAVVTLASVAAIVSAAPVRAQEEVEHRAVSYRDLDLSQPQDVARLHGRILHAARSICDDGQWVSLERRMEISACIRKAEASTVSQLAALLAGGRRVASRSGSAAPAGS